MFIRILVIFLFVLSLISNDEITIEWNENQKLSWSDFKGSVETRSDAVAVTASGITFSFSVKQSDDQFISFNATVNAHFYPEKSWYNKSKGDGHILAHEQLHFDITELYVRKLRHEISKLEISQDIKKQLRALHQKANSNLAQMQNDYDAQTENSINKEQQIMWSQLVKAELEKYKDYRTK